MAEAIIWEFDGIGRAEYDAVNEQLGVDPNSGGSWADGLLFHVGAGKPGGWVVIEVWESKGKQEQFLNERLMPAFEAAGLTTEPTRVEWLDVAGYVGPGS